MNVALELPDEIGRVLAGESGDLSRAVLEAVAVQGYRSGRLTTAQVGELLGIGSRWDTDEFLKKADAYIDYTADDLEQDIRTLRG